MKPQELKALRKSLHLTQARAAQIIGVNWKTWANWEQGLRQPHPAALKLIEMLPHLISPTEADPVPPKRKQPKLSKTLTT